MSDDDVPYSPVLTNAEDQLHWGSDPDMVEAAAVALSWYRPGSDIAKQLLARAAKLRASQAKLPTHDRLQRRSDPEQ